MTNDELQLHIKAIRSALNSGAVELTNPREGPEGLPVRGISIHCDEVQPSVCIRPKPREVWIHPNAVPGPDDDNKAIIGGINCRPCNSIHFREVIE